MTERWQREVRKLHELEPSPSVWDDAAGRPSSEGGDGGGPPARKRVMAGVLAMVVFIVAGLFAWQAFRPNHRVSPAESSASDVLRIRCDAQSLEVLTPVVAAQPDGVHVLAEISGIPDPAVSLTSSSEPQVTHLNGSEKADEEFVRQLPPGDASVSCLQGPMLSEASAGPTGSFSVVDPQGLFIDYRLSCTDPQFAGTSFQDTLDAPPAATPKEAIFWQVDGLMPGDVIERAGYPVDGGPGPHYRLTRDGQVIGWFIPSHFQDNYYVIDGRVCPGYGLSPSRSEGSQPTQSPADARALAVHFLELRLAHAESDMRSVLSNTGENAWSSFGAAPLYDPRYVGYEIRFVDGPSGGLLGPAYEVGIVLRVSSGDPVEETLFIGPGASLDDVERSLVVNGARPGLAGP